MPVARLRITAPMASVGGVYHVVSTYQGLSEEFTADGLLVVTVAVEKNQVGRLAAVRADRL